MELGDLLSLVFVAIVVLSVLSNIFSRDDDEPADAPRPTDLNESGRTGQRPVQPPVRRTGQPVVTSERGAGTQGRMPQTVVTSEADGAGRGRMPQTVVTSEADGAGRGRMPQTVVTREADGAGRGRMPQTVVTREADGAGRGRMPQTMVSPVPTSSRDTVSMEELYPEEQRRLEAARREVRRRVDDVPMAGEIGARRRRPAAAAALGTASPTMLLRRSLRDRTTVRRAFVVKELLDRPVGLREER